MAILDLFIWYVCYSFVGWAWESALFTVQEKRFVNRGFLNGPLCPIYGAGALLLLWVFWGRTGNLLVLFFAALCLTTALEYITAVLLEKFFKAKWWDYSMYPLNFQGRISPLSSFFFAVMSVLLIRVIHPFVKSLTDGLPFQAKQVFLFIFIIYFIVDLSITIRHVLILNGRLSEIQTALNGFFSKYTRRAGALRDALLVSFEDSEFYSERIKMLFSLDRYQNRRIFRAFPKLRSLRYNDALKKLKDRLLNSRSRDGNDDEE